MRDLHPRDDHGRAPLGPAPTLEKIRTGLAGNLCRCTGYEAIYRAMRGSHEDRDLVARAAQPGPSAARACACCATRKASCRWPAHRRLASLNFGTLESRRFLNLWGCDRCRHIGMQGGHAGHRALATYTDDRARARANAACPCCARPREIGGVQIQNRGTLGGNIANASPAGDTLPGARRGRRDGGAGSVEEERRVPFADFYTGYRQTRSRPTSSSSPSRSRGDRRHPVVPQGWHPRGPGDIQGGHGAVRSRAAHGPRQRGTDRDPAAAHRGGARRGRRHRRGGTSSRRRSTPSTICAPPPPIGTALRATCSGASGEAARDDRRRSARQPGRGTGGSRPRRSTYGTGASPRSRNTRMSAPAYPSPTRATR